VVPHRDEPSSQWLLLTSQPFDLGLGRRPRGGDAQSATLRGPTSPAGDALSNRIDWYASPRSGMSMLPRSCTSDSRSHDGVVIATSARWGASGEPLVGGVVARNPLSMLGSLRVASDNGCGELPSRTAIVRILRNSKKSGPSFAHMEGKRRIVSACRFQLRERPETRGSPRRSRPHAIAQYNARMQGRAGDTSQLCAHLEPRGLRARSCMLLSLPRSPPCADATKPCLASRYMTLGSQA